MRSVFYTLLAYFTRPFRSLYSNRLRVLAYHDVIDTEKFQSHLEYLKTCYTFINIEQLKNHLFNNQPLPKFPLLLTFDDGDPSVLYRGLPLMEKLAIPGCLFVITGLINTSQNFWWETVKINENKNGLNKDQISKRINEMKNLENVERLRQMLTYTDYHGEQLTTQDLLQMTKKGLFIANHSHTHPLFNRCTIEEIQCELANSSEFFLKSGLNGRDVFAYPNGNYDSSSETLLKSNEIKLAFLFDHRLNKKKINTLRISRIRVNSDMGLAELKAKVSGIHSFFYHLTRF